MLKTVVYLTLPFALLDDGTYNVSLDNKKAIIILKRENTVSRQGQMMGGQFLVPQGATMKMENDFYSVYKVYTDNWQSIEVMEQSKIRQKHDEETKRLTNFIINYSIEIDYSLKFLN